MRCQRLRVIIYSCMYIPPSEPPANHNPTCPPTTPPTHHATHPPSRESGVPGQPWRRLGLERLRSNCRCTDRSCECLDAAEWLQSVCITGNRWDQSAGARRITVAWQLERGGILTACRLRTWPGSSTDFRPLLAYGSRTIPLRTRRLVVFSLKVGALHDCTTAAGSGYLCQDLSTMRLGNHCPLVQPLV